MPTIQSIAAAHHLTETINRAISFSSSPLSVLWSIPVETNFRLKSSAGRATYSGRIELHPGLYRTPSINFIATFLHEVAHQMQFLEYGQMDHGATWWEAMIRLGRKPWTELDKRTHNLGACKRPGGLVAEDISLDDLGI